MSKTVIDFFKDIAATPHCSFETEKMNEHIKSVARSFGYEVQEDKVGNILCKKGSPKICLQSHYDMVCMGDAPNLELFEENGWLKAKNSSLGADNGMGMAIMFAMMEKYNNLECLFTNDEEVGLIGANNLELTIESKNLLNLDTEEEDEVIIGCAGGIVMFSAISSEKEELKEDLKAYEVVINGLDGGHSGIDIANNTPNAIKMLTTYLIQNECQLHTINGGERNNSIPQGASAVAFSPKELVSNHPKMSVKALPNHEKKVLKNSHKILHSINSFSQGVRSYDEKLRMPITSINLSIIKQDSEKVEIEFYGRSMQQEGIDSLKSETTSLFEGFGFALRYTRDASPWQPVENEFAKAVFKIAKEEIGEVRLKAIHAGLECGVIVLKQPSITGVCSIGPTIVNPHSTRERCNIASVEKITKVVERILGGF